MVRWRSESGGGQAEQAADGRAEPVGVVHRADGVGVEAAQRGGQGRRAEAMAVLVGEQAGQVLGGAPVAARVEQAGEQLLGGLVGREVQQLLVLARQHEAGLQLEQRRDEHEELGGDLEVELPAGLEVVEVGQDDVGQLDLEQVDLLAQDEGQEQVERPAEDLEVELERGDGHPGDRSGPARRDATRAAAAVASAAAATTANGAASLAAPASAPPPAAPAV